MQTLHIISHTHWDREWYLPFQQFRLKLVHLVDGLLDLLDQDANFKHFMLDGQTIVLDDYLLMRPEKEEIIRRHVQSGRILIGPWHILPDMYLVGPEAHIRNLLQGERTSQRFGPKMMVGYIPDPFGHPAQVPQILRGFGIESACLWRGLDDQPVEFWWQAPDGSRVLMAYLRDSYSNGASLPADDLPAFADAVAAQGDSLAAHSAAHDYLIMFGTDHMQPPRNSSTAITYADKMLKDTRVLHSTLPAYVAALQETLNPEDLPVVKGELRSCRRMHLLPGVLSTRMWIKQRNHASENLLTRWAEPFSTFAEWVGDREAEALPSTYIQQPASLIRQTWRLLMENHPHDSICGCSVDQVHDEMKVRFDQVDQVGEELTRQSLERLAAEVDLRPGFGDSLGAIVVFNPAYFIRTDSVRVEIKLPPDTTGFEIVDQAGQVLPHEMVGFGMQDLVNTRMTPKELRSTFGMINEGRVMGLGIRNFNVRRVGSEVFLDVTFSQHDPDPLVWERGVKEVQVLLDDPTVASFLVHARTADVVQAVFHARDIPALGWRTFYLRQKQSQSAPAALPFLARALLPLIGSLANTAFGQSLASRLQNDPASKPPYVIENEYFKVEVEPEGMLVVTDKGDGSVYRGLNRFVDGADCGDEYNYSPPLEDALISPRLKSVAIRRGAVCQTLTLEFILRTSAALSSDRKRRSPELVDIPIQSVVKLTQGVPRVDIHTEVDNRARDHRLRVHFPTPFMVDRAVYDSHFGPVSRPISLPPFDRETWVEDPRPEVPQRSFTDISVENDGITLANRGLPEVEAIKTSQGVELSLTLLRCVGWLSRDDFSTRRGHAGPMEATPGAQMIGRWAFDYAVCPRSAQQQTPPHELAYGFETSLRAVAVSIHDGSLPERGSFVTMRAVKKDQPDKKGSFIISAVKQAEVGEGWLVRGYNPGQEDLLLSLTPLRCFKHAWRANLAEQKLERLPVGPAGGVSLTARGGEIVTVIFAD